LQRPALAIEPQGFPLVVIPQVALQENLNRSDSIALSIVSISFYGSTL
jgi:hypothetical protein